MAMVTIPDALIDALGDDLDDAEPENMDLRESIREAWIEAITGKTRPIEELWDESSDGERLNPTAS